MSKEQFDTYIDALSREAAEHYTQPFNEESWQKMEALLEEDQPKRRPIIFWWWLLPILLIGGGLLYYSYYAQNNSFSNNKNLDTAIDPIKQSKQQINQTINQPQDVNTLNIPEVNKVGDKIAGEKELSNQAAIESAIGNTQKGSVAKNIPDNKLQIKKSVNSRNSTSLSKSISLQLKKLLTGKNGNTNNTDDLSSNKNNKVLIELPREVEENKVESGSNLFVKQENPLRTGIVPSIKNILSDSNKTELQEKANISTAKLNATDTLFNKGSKSNLKKSNKQSGFEFGVFAALDATTVKFKKRDKLSPAVGILIGYNISPRWSVATGIGIAQKLYRADSIDYSYYYYLPRNSIMTDIKADCRVLEIPLNVQYVFNKKSTHSWGAIAGLSNYFMLSEQYVYEFTENGVPKTSTVLFKNQNNHIFSVLNLAVAYRRNINKQFSWQLTPYLKLPLSGIGQGRVQLASFGLMGSLNFSAKK